MAYKVYRLRQKVSDGYDIFHIESNTDLVLRFNPDGSTTTLEDTLATHERQQGALAATVKDHTDNLAEVKAAYQTEDKIGKFLAVGDGVLAVTDYSAEDFAKADHTHGLAALLGEDADRVVVTDGAGALATSTITKDELESLVGISASDTIQTQLNNKAPADHTHAQYVPISDVGSRIPSMTDGKIDSQYLPSFVDDVVEGILTGTTVFTANGEEITPEDGKIYVDTNTNITYRWSGTIYVAVGGGGVALGETAATAHRGDHGKVAYDHSQAAHARADATAVQGSTTNGNLQINGTEVAVYTHPTHAGTKTDGGATAPGFGGSFLVLTAITLANGHVAGYTTKNITLPARPVDISFSATQPTNQQTNDLWFQSI